MPQGKKTSSLLALIGAYLLLAGCGGGDPTLSKAEFIEKADAICKRADKTQAGEAAAYQRAHLKELVNVPYSAQMERIIPIVLLPSIEVEVEKIEALGVPSEDKKQINEFLAGVKEALEKAEKNPASIEASRGAEGPFRSPDQLGRKYGFKACDEIT